MTILSYVDEIAQQLQPRYSTKMQSAQVAWWLLQHLTKKSKATLIAEEYSLSHKEKQILEQWLHQIIDEYKPIQYILESMPFCNTTLFVKPPVLIPRPETEEWCCNLIDQLKKEGIKKFSALDLCTGTGCVAIALARAFDQATITATDISPEALELARTNAEKNHVTSITFIQSDLFNAVPQQKFDIIVANPPYVSAKAWSQLPPSVRKWEDKKALVASDDGLNIIKKIIDGAPQLLNDASIIKQAGIPQLWIEIGFDQGQAVKDYMINAGFSKVTIKQDYAHNDRVVTGTW